MNVRTLAALLSSSLLLACSAAEPGGFASGEDAGDGWSLNNGPRGDAGTAGGSDSGTPNVDAGVPDPDPDPDPDPVDAGVPDPDPDPDPDPIDAGGPDPVDAGGPDPVDAGGSSSDAGSPTGPCSTNSDCSSGTVCCANTSGTLECTPEADCFFDGTCTQDSECPNGGECCDFSQFGIPQNVCRPNCGMGGGGMTGGCMNSASCAADEVCCPSLTGAAQCEPTGQCAVGGLCSQDSDCRNNQRCCTFGGVNTGLCNDRCSF